MSNKRDLKAFVRFDGSGRIVAGSLILRKNKPKVGKWHEIQAYECCNYVPTTTTTTTASPTTTTTTTALGPSITITSITNISPTGADFTFDFSPTDGSVFVAGVALSTMPNPNRNSIPRNSIMNPGSPNTISIVAPLDPSTFYYVRAWIQIGFDTYYSTETTILTP